MHLQAFRYDNAFDGAAELQLTLLAQEAEAKYTKKHNGNNPALCESAPPHRHASLADSNATVQPFLLDIGHLHLCARLAASDTCERAPTSAQLHATYEALLSAPHALPEAAVSLRPKDEVDVRSHNFVITRTHMHLVPRRDRGLVLMRGDEEWFMTCNALPIAGAWHVADEQDAEILTQQGLRKDARHILREVAYPIEAIGDEDAFLARLQ